MLSSTVSPETQIDPLLVDPLLEASQGERWELALTAARLLHENGQETHGTLTAFGRLSEHLGIQATLLPAWGELFLQVNGERVRVAAAVPSNINMSRVAATLQTVDAICAGHLSTAEAKAALEAAGRAPESNLLLFVFACAAGAGALVIINGASHPLVIGIVALCAAAGALLRRGLEHRSANSLQQIFAASLLAGIVGAAAIGRHLHSPLALVALGPLLVLVPGPAIVNGIFDLDAFRLPLGGARLGFGLLTVLAICAGVLIGLSFGGTTVPTSLPTRITPLWLDVLCAGIAAASYGIFFAMPLRMLVYPVGIGMLAHAVHWWAVSRMGLSNATGVGFGCLLVGLVLVPIAHRIRLPFAAVGFASVVCMVPGSYLFRVGGGLVQVQKDAGVVPLPLLGGILADGTTALSTIVAIALGLLVPIKFYDHLSKR